MFIFEKPIQLAATRLRDTVGAGVCRSECGACCVAPSIHSPIPGMPEGKPAGVPCVQLLEDYRCALFGKPERPAFCQRLRPSEDMCGNNRAQALHLLDELERRTQPSEGELLK